MLHKMTLGFFVALQSTGILDVSFNPDENADKALSVVATKEAGTQPGWLTPYGDNIYAISRTGFPDNSSESGGVFSFQKTFVSHDVALMSLNSRSSNGRGGVHCEVHPSGNILAAANIEGATMSVYPLLEDGSIGEATQTFQYEPVPSGDSASPHESKFDPTGQFVFVPCRTSDRVYVYLVHDVKRFEEIQVITLPNGTGPRHTIFKTIDATTAYMYLVSENDNTVRVFKIDYNKPFLGPGCVPLPDNLTITLVQTISTLGKDLAPTPPDHTDLASEIALTNDGKFFYVSNRHTKSMDSDKLSIYSVNDDSLLTFLGSNETLGKIPRHFSLSNDPDNTWVAVANQLNQEIVVFERDISSGFLKDVRGRLSLGDIDMTLKLGPMCVLWK